MVLCAKRVVPDILAAKCSTWVLVEEFWTKLTSYDVIHNITVFGLKVQDWERNGFNKAWGIIELKTTDKYKKEYWFKDGVCVSRKIIFSGLLQNIQK